MTGPELQHVREMIDAAVRARIGSMPLAFQQDARADREFAKLVGDPPPPARKRRRKTAAERDRDMRATATAPAFLDVATFRRVLDACAVESPIDTVEHAVNISTTVMRLRGELEQ